MKVAQLTFNVYNNYGNVLQKYALQKTLEKFVDFTEVLWFNAINNSGNSSFWAETATLPHAKSIEYCLREAVRMAKFKEFDERHIKTRFNLPYIEETADDYDFFVVGSDQVWNPSCEPVEMPFSIKFLDFVPNEKKIAYAASIALKALPADVVEICRRGMSSFQQISVREKNSADIIKKLTGRDVEVLLDPVLLLTRDEWLKIAYPPSWLKEKYQRGYILTYFFNNARPTAVDNLAKKLNLPVIRLFDDGSFNHYTTSPAEFLYLFNNATAIFTNSFHGTAFSILFRKPFVSYVEINTWFVIVAERIISLLKMFGLENRLATQTDSKFDSPLEIDFSTRDKILPPERVKAFKFLSNALGVEER